MVETGVRAGNFVDRFAGLGLEAGTSHEGMYQVVKAVEDAESTIVQQKSNAEKPLRSLNMGNQNEQIPGIHEANLPYVKGTDKNPFIGKSLGDPTSSVVNQNGIQEHDVAVLQSSIRSACYTENNRGTNKLSQSVQPNSGNHGVSLYSLPSSPYISPSRLQKDLDQDNKLASSIHHLMQTYEGDSCAASWKQDLMLKIRKNDEEILQLKRHLTDYFIKEAHICNDNYILEKRMTHMRMAFDQQQQDLAAAASKSVSYRQAIIEENIFLTHALQSAQEERSTYISSLIPLLSEYGLQPAGPDALSIVGNVKVLLRQLHERQIITEEKLKESQYQMTLWHTEPSNSSSLAPQSPSNSYGAARSPSNKNGLEIVPQPPYFRALSPFASPGHQNFQPSPSSFPPKSPSYHDMGNSSPCFDRTFTTDDIPSRDTISQDDSHAKHFNESKEKSLSSRGFGRGIEMNESVATGNQHASESAMQFDAGSSLHLQRGNDDPHVSFPYLPTVIEEHSSFSEDDDPLPAIEGLQFSGEAYPGRELQACGYHTNGTTNCYFLWARFLEDGSVKYIEFAGQSTYLVTADDVNCYLAVEVQPLDGRMRKGEVVEAFANEQRKITCDPEMQEEIERILSIGQSSFAVSIPAGALDFWESAVLAIKTEGYSIKCNEPRNVVVSEKFTQHTKITIPPGQRTEFSIQGVGGVEYLLRAPNSSVLRDTIVLTLRLFKARAVEKKRGRRKVLFFK